MQSFPASRSYPTVAILTRGRVLRAAVVIVRIALGVLFIAYGAWKVGDGYVPLAETDHPVGLFFRFMEDTGFWWDLVGWTQIVAGVLLITQRFATVGALILLPVVVNILAVNVSLYPAFGATIYLTGVTLALTLFLVAYDYPKWKYVFWRHPPDAAEAEPSVHPG
jgi:uncharacterized membrane protein YphA (DoxX/SURF4 family)